MTSFLILRADARSLPLADGSVHTVVTSPPYFGLRDYGVAGQIGLDLTVEAYVSSLVEVFREVRRVLRDDGTVWLNLGDSYAGSGRGIGDTKTSNRRNSSSRDLHDRMVENGVIGRAWTAAPPGFKQKDLMMIPARVAMALQADGWYLRQEIIWNKPNAMPTSTKDRPTLSHEKLFLLSKSSRYYYDYDAIAEPAQRKASGNAERKYGESADRPGSHVGRSIPWQGKTRNKRSVWTVPVKPYRGAHFATFPAALIRPCILAGSPEGGLVFDPFAGSGTTGVVAIQAKRNFIGTELNESYCGMARRRIADTPLTLVVAMNRNAQVTQACVEDK